MDADRFAALLRSIGSAVTRSRRAAMRLLAGSLITGLVAQRESAQLRAQPEARPDLDGDGLYDDDEIGIYGTNPDDSDTDGDQISDGEEVYLGTDPLVPNAFPAPERPAGGTETCPNCVTPSRPSETTYPSGTAGAFDCVAQGLTACGGVCVDTEFDLDNCGACGRVCPTGYGCGNGECVYLTPPIRGCNAVRTNCGGVCVDLQRDAAHCGGCFNSCALGGICQNGQCV